MMISEELAGSWDQPTNMIVMHNMEASKVSSGKGGGWLGCRALGVACVLQVQGCRGSHPTRQPAACMPTTRHHVATSPHKQQVQQLATQFADKATQIVELNERAYAFRTGGLRDDDDGVGGGGGRGRGRGGGGRGGGGGGEWEDDGQGGGGRGRGRGRCVCRVGRGGVASAAVLRPGASDALHTHTHTLLAPAPLTLPA
jgi:hypothetical protein